MRLGWGDDPGCSACLYTPEVTTLQALAGSIAQQEGQWINRPASWFRGTQGITSKAIPTSVLAEVAGRVGPRERAYLAAYLHPRNGRYVKHPLVQVCGMLHFEIAFQKNMELLPRQPLVQILSGHGILDPDGYSFGLCPDSWLPSHVMADSLTVKNAVPWLVQLALDGFVFLPAVEGGLTLFREQRFRYPVWASPLSCAAVSRLLQRPLEHDPGDLRCGYESLQRAHTRALSLIGWPRRIDPRRPTRTTLVA